MSLFGDLLAWVRSWFASPAPPPPVPVPTPVPVPGPVPAADPTGLIPAVNKARAGAGLRPLAYDAGLAALARQNNAICQRRGLGHWVTQSGAFGQCAAFDFPDAASVVLAFIDDPPHRDIVLGNFARAGGSHDGGFWTINFM
jgi:hypothetical protein